MNKIWLSSYGFSPLKKILLVTFYLLFLQLVTMSNLYCSFHDTYAWTDFNKLFILISFFISLLLASNDCQVMVVWINLTFHFSDDQMSVVLNLTFWLLSLYSRSDKKIFPKKLIIMDFKFCYIIEKKRNKRCQIINYHSEIR